jgi:transposase InsO family protein
MLRNSEVPIDAYWKVEMAYTIFGQQYNEDELRQLLALRDLFDSISERIHRTGERSERTQLPKDALAGALDEKIREGFIEKLTISGLIQDGYSKSTFFFDDQRFADALQESEQLVDQIERERRKAEEGQAERQEQKRFEQHKFTSEERGRSRQWTYYRVVMLFGATRPDETWHVDTTLIRLLDGSKAYLHAVIDNFSRRVLAWRVNGTFIPAVTAELLIEAGREIEDAKPKVLVDSGVLKRILAQTEIRHSNSLIESWWRVIKHQWLFLNTLDTVASVRKLVAFYVEQHNRHLPHSAFKGQTPDEMYFGTGDDIPKKLEEETAKRRVLASKSPKGCGKQQGWPTPNSRSCWRSTQSHASVSCM